MTTGSQESVRPDACTDSRATSTLGKVLALLTHAERRQLISLAPLVVMSSIIETANVALLLPFLALLSDPRLSRTSPAFRGIREELSIESDGTFLILVGASMMAAIVVGNALGAWTTWRLQQFAWLRSHSISLRLMERYSHLPYSFFLSRHSAELTKNVLSEVSSVVSGVLGQGLTVLSRTVTVLLVLLALILLSPGVALTAGLLFGTVYGLIYWAIRRQVAQLGRSRLEANRERHKVAVEFFQGIKEIKLLGAESTFLEAFSLPSRRFATVQARTAVAGIMPRFALEALALGGVLLLIAGLSITGEGTHEVFPLIGLYLFASYRMLPGLQAVFLGLTTIRANSAALELVLTEMHMSYPEGPGEDPRPLVKESMKAPDAPSQREIASGASGAPARFGPFQSLVLSDLGFSYPAAPVPSLSMVNLTVRKGEWLAVVGSTGSGKSTLIDLMLGLLLPTSGSLRADGVLLGYDNISDWQSLCGYVPQSIFLADDTIERNIAFGIDTQDIDRQRLQEVCSIADLEDVVTALPQRFLTRIGERGTRLSGGQRQRIGIARAIYRNPEFLVLDEATSALDTVTEDRVFRRLRTLAPTITVVSVAHRLSTTKYFDRIAVISNGLVVDEGTYLEVAARNPLFSAESGPKLDWRSSESCR